MENKLKIDENTVVHCRTAELANSVMNVYILTMSDNYNWEGISPDSPTVCGVYSSIEVAKSHIPRILEENYVGNDLEIKFKEEGFSYVTYRDEYMHYDITFDIEEFKLINNN